MFDVTRKIMAAAEELGTVNDFCVLDWGSSRTEKLISLDGITESGVHFELELRLKRPTPDTENVEVGE